MQFKYFKADYTTTIEEAKRQYHKLCLRWHPDRPNGDLKAMQAINAEWDYLYKHNFNIHETAEGGTYTDWNQDTPDDVTSEFADLIAKLVNLDGLEIEICGSWLWVGGNTKEHKSALKEMGMRWAPKKHRWYKAPKNWKRKSRRELTMSEIRDRFGSQSVHGKQRIALTA